MKVIMLPVAKIELPTYVVQCNKEKLNNRVKPMIILSTEIE